MALIAHWPLNGDTKDISGNNKHAYSSNRLVYKYYTHTYSSHANNASELDNFFTPSGSVTYQGTGFHNQTIDFSTVTGGKPAYLPADAYSWMVEGYIIIPESGIYTFGVDADDATDITVNGYIVASWYGGHGFANDLGASHSGSMFLDEGMYTFRARFEEIGGGDGIKAYWKKPGDSSFSLIPAANFSATIDNDGKIGQAVNFTAGPTSLQTSTFQRVNGDEISVAVWFKQFNRTGYQQLVANRSISTDYNWLLYFHTNDGSIQFHGSAQNKSSVIPTLNEWNHVVATVNKGQVSKLYLNGELVQTVNNYSYGPSGSPYIHIGSSWTGVEQFSGYMNDVRIYDYALSELEIQEIYKTKILHYTFDDFQEPTTNLIPTNFMSDYSFDGSGYGTVGTRADQGNGIVLITNSNSNSRLYRANIAITPFIPYTVQVKIKKQTGTGSLPFRWQIQGRNSSSSVVETIWTNTTLTHEDNFEWQTLSYTFTFTNGTVTNLYLWFQSGADYTAYTHSYFLKDPQLEQKDHSTPFVNGSRTGQVRDNSEFLNHANPLTEANSPEWISDTKMGTGAYKFNGSNHEIQRPMFNQLGYNSFTVNMWAWFDDSGVRDVMFGNFNSTNNFNFEKLTNNNLRFYWNGSPDVSTGNVIPIGQWCMLTLVRKRLSSTSSAILMYVNGSQVYNSVLTVNDLLYLDGTLRLGRDYRTTTEAMKGKLDDVRVYMNSLEPSDILDLYETRAQIQESGNVYIRDVEDTKLKSLLLNYTQWTVSSGSIGSFGQNGSTSENNRILSTDPWGKETVVWQTSPAGDVSADGGWNSSYFTIDNDYTYRFSVWVKRISSGSSGNFYLGMNPAPLRNDNGASQGNPYFVCPGTGSLEQNKWYLVVGHIMYKNYTGGRHPDSGVYTLEDGDLGAIFGSCNLGIEEGRWASSTTSAMHRTYHFYSDTTAQLQFVYPRMDKLDGSEPTISELLLGFDSDDIDYVRDKGGVINEFDVFQDKTSKPSFISTVGITDGLLGYWQFNGDTLDYSGNGYHGVEYSSGSSPIINTNNIKFQSGDGLKVEGIISEVNNKPFTIIIMTEVTTHGSSARIGMGYPDNVIELNVRSTFSGITVRDSNGYVGAYLSTSIPTGTPFLYTGTFDGSTIKYYHNGVYAAQYTGHLNNVSFGSNFIFGNWISLTQSYQGKIYYAKIFNRALSAEEIKIEYNTMFDSQVQIHEDGVLHAKDIKQY